MNRYKRFIGLFLFFGVLITWIFFFLPKPLGGPIEYIYVNGSSMTGTLNNGDLVLSKSASNYKIGDIVVFETKQNGTVVHRLVSFENNVFRSKGDNLAGIDPWVVSKENIRGVVIYRLSGVGTAVAFLISQPLIFALGVGILSTLSYLPKHRKRLSPELQVALQFGYKERLPLTNFKVEKFILAISMAGLLASGTVTVLHYVQGKLFTIQSLPLVISLIISSIITSLVILRLFDGHGFAEPTASSLALSGKLYRVDDLPKSINEAKSVKSARELRKISDDYRLPVLHHVSEEKGTETFMLITSKKGSFKWVPPQHSLGRASNFWESKKAFDSPRKSSPVMQLFPNIVNTKFPRFLEKGSKYKEPSN